MLVSPGHSGAPSRRMRTAIPREYGSAATSVAGTIQGPAAQAPRKIFACGR
ncbi:hypothetical protein LWP59_12600 [Amycolatopsis acidiphila]|uniref:hypothetical protein n=1 Tax=Amycolatopsis acidiphila TaxID=715473 RepID=UPI0016439EC0|nr:hypothetical protein [Amycolatopsis acidiphila]UIJ62393.1 hypothetical protein LWP59_12600 [Amycolatopsis acidiphila]GHG83433.1 hypothetical protein GCM10017788_54530 [Amycolatopsis acidiphila]